MAHLIDVKNCRDLLVEREFNAQELGYTLRTHFGGQFICLKWENENSLNMIIFMQVDFIVGIKHCFHRISSGHIWHPTINTSSSNESDVSFIMLCQKNSLFLCNNSMMHSVIEKLCIYLDANDLRSSFMEYNSEDSSFKPKHQNKNCKENKYSFSDKLYHRIRPCDSLFRTNCVITSDKPSKDTNNCERQTISTHKNKKPIKAVEPRSQVHSRINLKKVSEASADPAHTIYYVCNVYPVHGTQNTNPLIPEYMDDSCTTGMSLQESIRDMIQRPDQITDLNDIGHGLQSLSLLDERHLCNTLNSYSGASHTPTKYEDSMHTTISGQFVSLNGATNVTFELNTSQEASKHEICISGSSFERSHQYQHNEIGSNNARVSATDYRLPLPLGIQNNRPFGPGLSGDIAPANHQQQIKQQHESSVTEVTRPQDVARQRKRTDDILHVLGRVRSPENASLTDRLHTFSRWPSDIFQTPARVAEAGFYYTGLQDIVRCFACDGGLKNWDPEDDPWVEHARWFPQCVYVRHIKGDEFINLVQMMADESDDESDYTMHRGATWGGVENNNTTTESASNETTEPSVLENKAAQFVLKTGYSERHVALAINYILKKGKLEYTEHDIIDVILEKKIGGERIDSKLACNNSSPAMTSMAAAHTMSENQRLKKLLQCIECNTKERNILFLPCTHHVVCESCSRDLDICTSCYRKIKEKVRTYMA